MMRAIGTTRDRCRRCRASRTCWFNSSVTVTLETGTRWIAAVFLKRNGRGVYTVGFFLRLPGSVSGAIALAEQACIALVNERLIKARAVSQQGWSSAAYPQRAGS